MEGCRPADFYEDYKKLYAKAAELNNDIGEAMQLCIDICERYTCPCGGEDCKYRSLGEAQSTLESLITERSRVIRLMENVARSYVIALQIGYAEMEMLKETQSSVGLLNEKLIPVAREIRPKI
jgi:hypothetical protein